MSRQPSALLLLVGALLLLAPPRLALAQAPLAEVDAALAAAEATLNEIALQRALIGSRLTPTQLTRLLPTLERAHAELAAVRAEGDRALAAHEAALRETAGRLAAGQPDNGAGENAYRQAVAAADQRVAQRLDAWRAALIDELRRIATPEQRAAIARTTEALERLARGAERRLHPASSGALAVVGDQLDTLRAASDEGFAGAARQFARRFVRRPPLAVPPNAAPELIDALEEARDELFAALLHPYEELAQRLREMPRDRYAAQRAAFAEALLDAQLVSRRGEAPPSDEERLAQFVDRFLLSPRVVAAMRARLAASPR